MRREKEIVRLREKRGRGRGREEASKKKRVLEETRSQTLHEPNTTPYCLPDAMNA